MDVNEGVGESSSPPPLSFWITFSEFKKEVFNRFMELGNEEARADPPAFRKRLDAHFDRLPDRYVGGIILDVEDVLLHERLLLEATDPDKQPAFHVQFLENLWTRSDRNNDRQDYDLPALGPHIAVDSEGAVQSDDRNREIDIEHCSKLEDLTLEVKKNTTDMEMQSLEGTSRRQEISQLPVFEVTFSTAAKHNPLSQLADLLYDIGLNIHEIHMNSTTDGYTLAVFLVDGWPIWETNSLHEAIENAIAKSKASCSSQPAVEKELANLGEREIDRRLLTIREQTTSGASGDMYRGVYLGQDVTVKVFKSENQTERNEFKQEVSILREVNHRNVVRFIGACTKTPPLCLITEYMAGGNLFEYLRKNGAVLELPRLVKFAIDVSKGMEYLHQQDIIHRDLKAANLLIDADNVVKVSDFGISRFIKQGDIMTRETGTYRWMAPEVLMHQEYDQRADIFSFAIVLWELVTAKVPHDTMTPLQAAVGVIQNDLRPEIPPNMNPKLMDLMKRCWDIAPDKRPSFSEIITELEALLQEVQDAPGPSGDK